MTEPLPDLVGERRRATWSTLAEAHPDVVRLRPGGLEVTPFLVDLAGGLRVRSRQPLPEGLLAFGWTDSGPPEVHVLVRDGRPGLVLVVSETDRLVYVGDDLDVVLDGFTAAASAVLEGRDDLVAGFAEVDSIDDLEPAEVSELLGEAMEAALVDRFPLLDAGLDHSDVPGPRRATELDLDDPVLAQAVAGAGDAWGRGLPADPAQTLVVDLRDAQPGAVADLTDLLSGDVSSWGGVDATGTILTWRLG